MRRAIASQAQVLGREAVHLAGRIQGLGPDQHVLDLLAVGAGVHAQRAAQGAGHPGQELEPADPGDPGGSGHVEVERPGAADQIAVLGPDADEGPAQAQHHARHAAVPHQGVGADPQDRHRNAGGQSLHEGLQVGQVGRAVHDLGRSADPEPGDPGQRRVFGIAAADRREPVDEAR
jgi:hypothetical protein